VAEVLQELAAMVRHKIQRVQSVRTVPATAVAAVAAATTLVEAEMVQRV
jgi:hypothetical protein